MPSTRFDLIGITRYESYPVQFVFSDKFSVDLPAYFKTTAFFLLETFLATLAFVYTVVLFASVVLLMLHDS